MYLKETGLPRAGRHLAASFVSLLLLTASAFASKDSVPDWVRAAAADKLPAYPAETNAVVLLDETTYTVAPDGTATEHHRRVVKILRPQGRDEAVVQVNFDKDTKILSLRAWSIGPDGHEYAVKDNEFSDVGVGQGELYADDKYRIARAPGGDPGGIVAYEYTQRNRPYITETTWAFQESIPQRKQSFILELPPAYTYDTVWAHHPSAKPVDLEHQRTLWEMQDVPAIDLEHVEMRPAEQALAGRMTIHYAGPGIAASTEGTWQGIGQWYGKLSHDRLAATPDISAKAQALTAGKTDFYDKAEAIGEYVQTQIRYFAIEMGIGGEQPHFAADIYRNHYGDCKDKATLLSSMLSSVGIHSALLMVDTRRGVVDPAAPSTYGNHMIAAIEIPKGYNSPRLRSVVIAKTGKRYLIFDPTWDKTPFGQLEHNLQGGYGILMEDGDSQAIELPVLPPELNTIHRTASFQLDPDGELKGILTTKRFGDISEDWRRLYTEGTEKEQGETLDHALKQDFTAFTISGFKVENVAALNKDLVTSYTVDASGYGKKMGPLLMVRPRVVGSLGPQPDRKPRKYPVDLRETMFATDDYNIELPAGYTVDELPDPIKIDVGFAAYESSSKVTGNVLHYTRTYTVREVTLPAEKYADLQRLAGVIAADENSKAVFKKQ
jgi:Domain of Unknown Function with PDB structure (DUF3857)/Transglutaminase-like superfamily